MNGRTRTLTVGVWCGVCLLGSLGAQEEAARPGAARELAAFLKESSGVWNVRRAVSGGLAKEPFAEAPESLGFAIERRLDHLAREGQPARAPWSAWWWPMHDDGVAHGGHDAPLATYGRSFGGEAEALAWERRHHGRGRDDQPERWFGHCNGWAAAAVLYPAPVHAVDAHGVRFEAAEIAALLVESCMACGAATLDRRAEVHAAPELDRFGRATDPALRDANPGALHLLLANLVARDGRGLVLDLAAFAEVWNHPVVSFRVEWLRPLQGPADAVAAITGTAAAGFDRESGYPFNATAHRFVDVRTRITVAASAAGPRSGVAVVPPERELVLDYVLELDPAGEIVGGEWARGSRLDHPDFAWVPLARDVALTVTPDGRPLEVRSGNANPWVDPAEVEALAFASASGAGDRPPAGAAAVGEGASLPGERPDVRGSTAGGAAVREASVPGPGGSPSGPRRGASGPGRPEGAEAAGRVDRRARLARFPEEIAAERAALRSAALVLRLAADLGAQGDVGLAIARLERAAAEPWAAEARIARALTIERGFWRFVAGDPRGALAEYATLPIVPDEEALIRERRALMLAAIGDHARALVEAARAIERAPADPWGYLVRAVVARSRGAAGDERTVAADLARLEERGGDALALLAAAVVQGTGDETLPGASEREMRGLPFRLRRSFRAPGPQAPVRR